MARDIELPCTIWEDDRFTGLRPNEQLLYIAVAMNTDRFGLGNITPNRFALMTNTSPADVMEALRGLAFAEWVDIDETTDDLFMRDAIRFGRIDKMPNVMRNVAEHAVGVLSPHIRRALAAELLKIEREDMRRAAEQIIAGTVDRRTRPPSRPKIPAAIRDEVYRRDRWECQYCALAFTPASTAGKAPENEDSRLWLELDHIVPYSLGGADTVENLRSACSTCNRRRGVVDADLWAEGIC